MANKPLKSITFPGLTDTYTIPQIDTSLTVGGKAADAQAVGDKLTEVSATAGKAFPTDTLSGDIVTFADGADDIPMKSVVVNIEPVQSGSGDPSPTNVRPISGWTGVNVVRTGKNLFDIEEYLKRNNITYEKDGDSFTFTPKQSMYNNPCRFAKKDSVISASVQSLTNITTIGIKLRFLDDSGTTVFTLDESTNSVKNIVASSVRVDWNTAGQTEITAPQIEFGAENTSYEPYTSNTYSITFQSEAGTVYGGTLDVTNGVLTVDMAFIASYNGETLPSEWISDRDKYVAGTTPTTGAQVCYKLSQAVVYTLTPTEIKSLLGDNNVWADTGDTEVTYRADTKLYIDKKIAEVINAIS